jgi:chloramphenicol-sensitive protein RarD
MGKAREPPYHSASVSTPGPWWQVMSERAAKVGVLYGVAAYGAWGLFPIYFKAVASVPPAEVLAHRIVWSSLFLAALLRIRGRWSQAVVAVSDRRVLLTLLGSTSLIGLNWFVFIYAISSDQVLQTALGYYINPLVNVLLGFVFLRERLRIWQRISVALAGTGVLYLAVSFGEAPWIALILAATFGLYGLLRKTVRVEPMAGLTVETALLMPCGVAYLAWLAARGDIVFGPAPLSLDLLLVTAGVLTAIPLLWFTNAARRLRLTTLGFLQYIAPTGQFLLAVLVYDEPFQAAHGITFAFIWTALAIYSIDAALRARQVVMPEL